MLKRIQNIASHRESRQVLSNVFSLSALQVANAILPLVTVPYIVRVIGPHFYGTIAFAQAFATYFVLLITYGFDFTASRQIAQNRQNPERIRAIFWTVMWCRLYLFALSTVVFGAALIWIPAVNDVAAVMLVSYLFVIGTVAFPTWFFQGVERLGATATFNFIVKFVVTVGVFVFLKRQEQFIIVPLLLTIGQIVAGISALVYAMVRYTGWVVFPGWRQLWRQLREGVTVFVSTVFMNVYTISNTVLLAFFASQESVGFFAGASKIVIAIRSVALLPISQSMFPHIAKEMKADRGKGVRLLMKMTMLVVLILFPISLGLFLFAGPIVRLVLGGQFESAARVVRVLSLLPLVVGLSNVFGVQGLLNLGQDKAFLRVIAAGSILDVILNGLLDPSMKEVGAAASWLLTEIFIAAGFFFALRGANVNIADTSFYRQWLFDNTGSRNV